jgi:hypothetical protein
MCSGFEYLQLCSHSSFLRAQSAMVVSRHIRRLTTSLQRKQRECRSTRQGVGRMCALSGAAATSRLSQLSLQAVKYWQRKWNNPNLYAGIRAAEALDG